MEKVSLIFIYLIIGHLLGDFLLQTSRLVTFKQKSIFGIILHCLIIWISQAILLLPYLFSLEVWGTITLIAIIHFGIDFSKIALKEKTKTKIPLIPFTLDQVAHFIVLYLGYLFIKNQEPLWFTNSWWFESLYQNTALLVYFSGIIFFSYSLDIVLLTFKLQKDPNYKYKRGYFDMLIRVAIFALVYMVISLMFN